MLAVFLKPNLIAMGCCAGFFVFVFVLFFGVLPPPPPPHPTLILVLWHMSDKLILAASVLIVVIADPYLSNVIHNEKIADSEEYNGKRI